MEMGKEAECVLGLRARLFPQEYKYTLFNASILIVRDTKFVDFNAF